jgi:hypothetical protein
MPVDRVAVAVVDLARAERSADRLQFVAGGKERDAQPAKHGDLTDAKRGHHAELRRMHEVAGAEHELPPASSPRRRNGDWLLPSRPRLPQWKRDRPSSRARSCMTTVSAPCGITAPVKMRTH